MNFYDENIKEIKSQGFESMNFLGYGGPGYKKGDLEIWWDEWGHAYIETCNVNPRIEISLCQISTEPIAEKLSKALKEIKTKL